MAPARVPNPYHFGAPAEDAHFTDRLDQLARLKAVMLNGQNMILIAPRRYGKTSLLLAAEREVREARGRTGRVSLIKCASEKDVAEALMKGVIDGPLGWLRGHVEEILQHISRLRLRPTVRFSESGTLEGLSFGSESASVNWREVIADVIRILNDVAQHDQDKPVSLILDEFQKAYEINPLLADVFKDLVDEMPRVSLVFAGSKRHLMEAMVSDPERGALYNVGAKLYLTKIPQDEFVPYLQRQATVGGKAMAAGVAERIYRAAAGIPNDVQLLAFWSFESAPGPEVDDAALRRAIRAAVGDQREEFEEVFGKLSLTQQRLLKHIAANHTTAVTGAVVQAAIGVSHTSARAAAEVLERAQLIQSQDGAWVVSSGLLSEWLSGDYD
ncbi:MAG TPA: hypothetical protein VIN65_02440 [Candidatus Dormibacteraeota bacterium]